MKVRDVIAKLSELDPDAEVLVCACAYCQGVVEEKLEIEQSEGNKDKYDLPFDKYVIIEGVDSGRTW